MSSSKVDNSAGNDAGDLDADALAVDDRPPPSDRVPLSRDRIVDAAIGYIDTHSLAALSMRRLGAELGVEAMSLYKYVTGREDLLDAIVDKLTSGVTDDPRTSPDYATSWQDLLQRLAHSVRRIALSHPKVFPLIASRPPEAPWLRPPLRSLDWVEEFLAGMSAEGFEDEAAVAVYRAFTSFLLGHLLLEVSTHGADVGPLDVLDDGSAENPRLEGYPHTRRQAHLLAQDHAASEFEESLESLLDRIALLRSEQ